MMVQALCGDEGFDYPWYLLCLVLEGTRLQDDLNFCLLLEPKRMNFYSCCTRFSLSDRFQCKIGFNSFSGTSFFEMSSMFYSVVLDFCILRPSFFGNLKTLSQI
jgi:hypothetical protein